MNFRFGMAAAFLGVCLCGGVPANKVRAADSDFSTHLWQMAEGLPHNIVQAITQTTDGYMWIGTREGLARFDGMNFQPVELSAGFGHASILSLLADKNGGVWVGAENAGLWHLQNGRISRCMTESSIRNFSVYQILADGRGVIWAATSAGVLKQAGDKFELISEFKNGLQSLCVDRSGTVWLGGNGIRSIEKPVKTMASESGTLPDEARTLYCDRDGGFWIGAHDGLTEFRDGVVTSYPKAKGPSGFVSVIYKDREGELWIGSYAGLSRFKDGKFVNENDPDEPSYRIYAIFEDQEGTLWVGSEEGLARLEPKGFKTITKKEGLSLNTVVTVCPSQDGSVWVGVWGGGVNHLIGNRIEILGKTNGLSSDFVLAMLESRDGSLWIGADYGSALNRLKNGQITHYGREDGFVASATTVMWEDSGGDLWIGTREGLYLFHQGKFKHFTTKDGLSHNKINALYPSRAGGFWIGTDAGLDRWKDGRLDELKTGAPPLKSMIFSLYEDADGTLWIGTKDAGLQRWKAGTMDLFTGRQGLYSESIYSILEDGRDNLWLNSSKGIFRLDKRQMDAVATGEKSTITCITYGKSDGIIANGQYRDVTQPAACKSKDGRMWFRTTQGVAVVDPEEIASNTNAPPVVIQQIISDKRPITTFEGQPAMPNHAEIRIPPGRGELEIQYAALSFRAPEKNQYKYKLAGVDLTWKEVGSRRAAYYNNLRPGRYEFTVTACNNDGVWNDGGATATVFLEAHFWETWWFATAGIFFCMGLVGGTARYATRRKMQQNLQRMEQQNAIEKERTRIARDIHDDLGARLTKISMLTEQAEREGQPQERVTHYLRSIYGTAREMLTQLDETVWAVNPRNDQLDQLADYIMHYAEEFLRHTNIRYRLKVLGDIPALPVLAEPRHHIFLAVKEALNNAARHANATEVQVQCRFNDGIFTVMVRDNGCGFDAAKSLALGRGLENMQTRVKGQGGNFELQTQPGEGTTITMTFKIEAKRPLMEART